MKVRSYAPMRLGLAGGGTDISSFADVYGGYVLNVTIGKYAITTIEDIQKPYVIFKSDDMDLFAKYKLDEPVHYTGKLDLLKGAYCYFIERYNSGRHLPIRVTTFCDAPLGSGLGASSTLMVSLVAAFAEYFGVGFGEYELASLAHKIEREKLGISGGKQDHYAAAFGGFNFMEFYGDGKVIINPLRIKDHIKAEIETNLLLYYSGISRQSAKVIQDQKKRIESLDEVTIQALIDLKNEAVIMKEAILTGKLDRWIGALNRGWEAKKKTAELVTNERLNEIYEAAIQAGALAGKISGAGSGGFFMFVVEPQHKKAVMDALQHFGGEVSNCVIADRGSFSWKV